MLDLALPIAGILSLSLVTSAGISRGGTAEVLGGVFFSLGSLAHIARRDPVGRGRQGWHDKLASTYVTQP